MQNLNNHDELKDMIKKYHTMLCDLTGSFETYIRAAKHLKESPTPYIKLNEENAIHIKNLSQILSDFKHHTSISHDDISDYMIIINEVSNFVSTAGEKLNGSKLLKETKGHLAQ